MTQHHLLDPILHRTPPGTRFPRVLVFLLGSTLLSSTLLADGPSDNHPENVRPIPPLGIEVSKQKIQRLQDKIASVRRSWKLQLEKASKPDAKQQLMEFESEVMVFPRCVELAIEFGQFYRPAEVDGADRLLDQAQERNLA